MYTYYIYMYIKNMHTSLKTPCYTAKIEIVKIEICIGFEFFRKFAIQIQ